MQRSPIARNARNTSPQIAYMAAGSSLTDFGYIDVRIEANGTQIATKAVFVSIANAHVCWGFHFAPMARVDTGLDLAIIDDIISPS